MMYYFTAASPRRLGTTLGSYLRMGDGGRMRIYYAPVAEMRLRRRRQVGRRAQARSFRAAKVARARKASRQRTFAKVAHSRLRNAQVILSSCLNQP